MELIYTHLIAAVLSAIAAWTFQSARMDSAIAEARLEFSNERIQAISKTRASERAINKSYQEALNESRKREISLRRDRDAARAESDGLREQSADTARRISGAPAEALREYSATVSELFTDCVRSYQGMAEKADGHALDVRTFIEAWPVNHSEH